MRRSWLKVCTCLIAGLYLAPAANSMQWQRPGVSDLPALAQAALATAQSNPEALVVAALNAIRQNRLTDADRMVDALLDAKPNYRLAHLLKGDLLMARAQPLAGIGSAPVRDDKLDDLRAEATVRLARYDAPPPTDQIPANLLQLTPAQKHALVVDASKSRVYLFRNEDGTPRFVRDFYVTIGKLGFDKNREGDQRTPLGVYFVTGHMPREQLDKSYGNRAELYGVGAWPLSYPNDWDKQMGRTGSGIWLHGVPYDTYSRAPKASNGCVALSNTDMAALGAYLTPNTPVIIAPAIQWLNQTEWAARRNQAIAEVEAWRRDWESLNTPRYLQHYASEFRSGNHDLASWKTQKAAVNAGKQWAKIRLDNVNLFAYPTREGDMLMADFAQDYRSSNLDNRTRKRLYFKQERADWKIVFEGSLS
ncbi:murein L,D-transpeptidase family protein [Chitinimonas sp. BJYL2]|uniref:L,D-transpeptidase family protein n=1 Tax=Chitinimonas sp. BJYL2 TaxID=2976696 RepID=UPI0022B433A6|nr:L,D-transpeptidase family protein [Chitinimonas sp. BJYL2]